VQRLRRHPLKVLEGLLQLLPWLDRRCFSSLRFPSGQLREVGPDQSAENHKQVRTAPQVDLLWGQYWKGLTHRNLLSFRSSLIKGEDLHLLAQHGATSGQSSLEGLNSWYCQEGSNNIFPMNYSNIL